MSDHTDTKALVSRGFDLTARVLDLTNSLSQASNLANGLVELGQWLAYEGVDRTELHKCFQDAHSFTYANSAGNAFYEKVASNSVASQQTWPLALRQSGALGRIIVKDPHLAWIASTTACLMQFHNDRVVSDALCTILLRADPRYSERPEHELRYLASRVEMKSVIDKLIGSIWFNVVNPGRKTEELPQPLQGICKSGHRLSGQSLGLLIHALKPHRDKIIVETLFFLEDLTSWLLLHFQGKLLVTVSGKVMFEEVLGEAPRTIELKIGRFCSENEDCSHVENSFKVLNDIEGSFEEFLNGKCGSSVDMPSTSKTRKKLYDFVGAYDHIQAYLLPNTIKTQVQQTSKAMLKWLLALNIVTPEDADYGFRIPDLDITLEKMNQANVQTDAASRIGSLLSRSPSLLNKFGKALDGTIVYAAAQHDSTPIPQDVAEDMSDEEDSKSKMKDASHPFEDEDLLHHFPILQDLVVAAKQGCSCDTCATKAQANHDEYLGYTIPSGCLSEAAVHSVLVLIAHAIAEGFGSPDISGSRDPQHILKASLTIFGELLERNQIRWDPWFSLAACVYLGCPFKPYVMDMEFGGTAYAAMQYGNLAVVSPWLNIKAKQEIKRSFRMICVEGKLGVLRDDTDHPQYFRGIMEKFAIIQTEHTEDVSSYTQKFEKWSEPLTGPLKLKTDDSTCDTEIIFVSATENVYRIILRIRSDTTLRVIDPADTMIRLARSVPYVECPHEKDYHGAMAVHDNVKAYSFDDVLGHWQDTATFYGQSKVNPAGLFHSSSEVVDERGLTYHISHFLSTPAQVNVALALSVNDMALLNFGKCCLNCAIEKALTMPLTYDVGEGRTVADRYIINVVDDNKKIVATGSKRRAPDPKTSKDGKRRH